MVGSITSHLMAMCRSFSAEDIKYNSPSLRVYVLLNSTLDSICSIRVSAMQLAFTWLVVKSVMEVLLRSYVFYANNFSKQGSQNSRSRVTNLQ